MAKGSNGRFSNKKTPQKAQSPLSDSDMDDEIDVFHKQRDIVPLNLDDDMADSDEDNDQHVFEIEDGSDDEDEDDDFEDDEDEEDTGLAAKIAKQRKSLNAKLGGAKDETQDDDEEEKEKKTVAWGRGKNIYYADHKGEESENEDEEEAEVSRLQNEKLKLYSNADHGLEEDDDSDEEEEEEEEEPTFEDKLKKGKVSSKGKVGHEDDKDTGVEVIVKDPSSLSKEEQMDIVLNSAPELVGLLAELNEAVDQLETKVDPILNKLKEEKNLNKAGIQYMELKKQLLLSFCQAITFHLLLKSEGHSVRDHPVVARLVEIKNLLDKMKPIDENLSIEVEDYLKNNVTTTTTTMDDIDISPIEFTPLINNHKPTIEPSETQKEPEVEIKKVNNGEKRKRENEQRGLQSVEMLKVRAALEEKLKQKGVFNIKASKTDGIKKNSKPLNGKLEARDDFDDDTFTNEVNQNKSRLSQLVTQVKKPRVISGDDDLPKRDDIGERRRKHEIRVLSNAGVHSDDDMQKDETTLEADGVDDMDEDGETESNSDSETDLYQETKLKRDAKLAAKAQKYSRNSTPVVAVPEISADGKRHINYEMEKNRGLTRKRNKDIKNPRKKYKLKHKKKEVARKGQVREHRKPSGPYGGEGSGINTISRSIRFKN